jgi:hypothetical protein
MKGEGSSKRSSGISKPGDGPKRKMVQKGGSRGENGIDWNCLKLNVLLFLLSFRKEGVCWERVFVL